MKRKNNILQYVGKIVTCIVFGITVMACGGGGGGDDPLPTPDPDPVAKLEVKPESISAGAEEKNYTIEVTATAAWTAKSDSSWCVPTGSGNALTLQVKANPYEVIRSVKVKVTMATLSKIVTVTQAAAPSAAENLEVGEPDVKIGYNQKDYSVTVTSNAEWTVSSDKAWCVAAREGERVTLTLELNEKSSERAAVVTVKGKKLQRTIQVIQTGITPRGLDSLALVEFMKATDGNNWNRKWDTRQSVEKWPGVKLDVAGERVEELVLRANGLSGGFPESCLKLGALKKLDLGNNSLDRGLPANIGALQGLEYLSLDSNRMTGNLPAGIGQLKALRVLDLGYNRLEGVLPTDWPALTGLSWLRLAGNQFDGHLPADWKALKALVVLDVSQNLLNGAIPPDWFDAMFKLEYFYLHGNQLEETIPENVVNLYTLKSLALDNNQLTGQIPDELGHLPDLTGLWLYNNRLTGAIPVSLTGHRLWSQWKTFVYPQQGEGFTGIDMLTVRSGTMPFRSLPDKNRFY